MDPANGGMCHHAEWKGASKLGWDGCFPLRAGLYSRLFHSGSDMIFAKYPTQVTRGSQWDDVIQAYQEKKTLETRQQGYGEYIFTANCSVQTIAFDIALKPLRRL
jgi:hypothetical protein